MTRSAPSDFSIPYFSQWESPDLVEDIVCNRKRAEEDPRWQSSDARDVNEYSRWANHLCGMACLKMVLAARTGVVWPTLDLARAATKYGAYTTEGDKIRGLIYAPFVTFVRDMFAMRAEVVVGVSVCELEEVMTRAEFFIASVHHAIRWPEQKPPRRGGHLVLVTAVSDEAIIFHNPSGHTVRNQKNAVVPRATFERFFAGRGIAILRG